MRGLIERLNFFNLRIDVRIILRGKRILVNFLQSIKINHTFI